MSGGMAVKMEEEEGEFCFHFDPDKSNEENCLNVIEQLASCAERIGAVDTTNDDCDSFAGSIMTAAEATMEGFERAGTQDKTVAIIGDQGQGKSTLINMLLQQTELDESQYGLVPAWGTPESGVLPAPRSRRATKPRKEDWERTIMAFPYLKKAVAQALKPKGTEGLKAKRSAEFKEKVEQFMREAVVNAMLPVPGNPVHPGTHRSDSDMVHEDSILHKTIGACNKFPQGNSKKDLLHAHLLRAGNKGDATSFCLTKLMWGPTYCALVRTKSVDQVIEEMTSFPFEQKLALFEDKKISPTKKPAAYKELLDMCAKLRVLAGEDLKAVETDEHIDRAKLPSFTNVTICDEISEKAGKSVIIAGHGFHKEHDRVFVREEVGKFVQPSISVIVEEVVFFAPSELLKKGLILIDPPGTQDKNPFHRAVTRTAVQQADLLVLLSRATLQQGDAFDFLRETCFLQRMLISSKTCKILLLSTLDEKIRKLTARQIFEQWDDPDEELWEARHQLEKSFDRFKSTLQSEHQAFSGGGQAGTDTESDDDDESIDGRPSSQPSSLPQIRADLPSFPEIFRVIEDCGAKKRNLACLPVAYTSLSLHKGDVDGLSAEERALVLEMTGGGQLLEQLQEMVKDKCKERMEPLVRKLEELTTDSSQNKPTASQDEMAPLPAAFHEVFERESKKKWTGKRDMAERDILLGEYDKRMNDLMNNRVESILDVFEEEIFEAVGGQQIPALKEQALNFIKNKTASNLMPKLIKGTFFSSRNKLHTILVGGIRLRNDIVQDVMERSANKITDAFKEVFAELLIDRIQDKLKGRTRTGTLSAADKENISHHVMNWCKSEFDSPTVSTLKSGLSQSFKNTFVNATFFEWCNAACNDSCEDMLTKAREIMDRVQGLPSTRRKEWKQMGNALKELVEKYAGTICTDARRYFAFQVREDLSERAEKFVRYFQAGGTRKRDGVTKTSAPRFLSVCTSCHKGLLKQCAKGEEEGDVNVDADCEERHEKLINLVIAFNECINDNVIAAAQSSSCVLQAEIERQQLMRWIRSKTRGLPSIMLQPGRPHKFAKSLQEQIMQNPLKYCSDKAAFKRVLDAMKADSTVSIPIDLSFEGSETLRLYKNPVEPDDGNSLFRAMIQSVAGIEEPTPEEIEGMRHRLVCNKMAECSLKATDVELFTALSGETVEQWGNKMKNNGMPGDAFVIESFCNYYKVNVLLITKLSQHRNVSFPAFRMDGATHPKHNFVVFVRFDGGVFCLVKPTQVRMGDASTRVYDEDESVKEDKKRHWRQIVDDRCQEQGHGGSPARASKRRALPQTPPHSTSARSGQRRTYPCPQGWTEHVSRSRSAGTKYYLNPRTGKTRWADEPPEEG